MSLVVDVIAWMGITVAALSAARYFVMLIRRPLPPWLRSIARVTPAQTAGERHHAWQWFRLSLLAISTAVMLLSFGWHNDLARWLLDIAVTVILIWDRALWIKVRMRHRAVGAAERG
jgi:hypothetical protein